MRLLVLILVFFVSTSVSLFAQDDVLKGLIEVDYPYYTKEDVLNQISKKTGLFFSFNHELPVRDTILHLTRNKQSVEDYILEMFGSEIEWQLINNKVLLKLVESDPEFYLLKGVIVDALTDMPLTGANIAIKDSWPLVGTISNFDGQFTLKVKKEYAFDSLVVSHMGYESFRIKISDNIKRTRFPLFSTSFALNEVLVSWENPRDLLSKAISSIKNNYPRRPTQLRAFYRETLKRDKKYMLYIESLLDIYKRSYKPSYTSDQAKLLHLRKYSNLEMKDTVLFKLQGGVDAVLKLDLLRNPLGFLSVLTMKNYEYEYEGMEAYNTYNAHKISFYPSGFNEDRDYKGSIYIDAKDLAILRVDFELTEDVLTNPEYNVIMRAHPRLKVNPSSIAYSLSYKKHGGKYHINHVSGKMDFKVKHKRKVIGAKYQLAFEMFTTDINQNNTYKISSNERLTSDKILTDFQVIEYYDQFDQHYAIIPEKNLIKALRKFKVEEVTFAN